MTEHILCLESYGAGFSTRKAGQLAMMIRRDMPINSSSIAFPGPFPVTVRPYALPLPSGFTADQFGVAYPAGTLMVIRKIGLTSPLLASYNATFEQYFINGLKGNGAQTILVPSVLPSGYTFNPDDGWISENFQFSIIRTANGGRFCGAGGVGGWEPSLSAWGFTATDVSGSGGVYANTVTGFRKVQVRAKYVPGAAPPAWSGSAVGRFNHTDGTGTTADATHSWTAGDFSFLSGSTWATSYADVGSALATLGVQAAFSVTADLSGVGVDPSAPTSLTFDFQLSPRVDVPLCYTQSGDGDLIAPGGYVP